MTVKEIEEAEREKERKLLRNAITNLQNRIKELKEINKEHQKENRRIKGKSKRIRRGFI